MHILATCLAIILTLVQSSPLRGSSNSCLSFQTKDACKIVQECVWCRSKAVPSSCLPLESAKGLPEDVFFCEFPSDSAAQLLLDTSSRVKPRLPTQEQLTLLGSGGDAVEEALRKADHRVSTGHTTSLLREAVLILSRDMPEPTSCAGRNLYHLASTAGADRDVWLLLNRNKTVINGLEQSPSRARVWPPSDIDHTSVDVFVRIGFQSDFRPEYNAAWGTFSSGRGRSRGSKDAMVMWMSEHVHQYSHVWHVEPDVLLTGARWSKLFGSLKHLGEDTVDVVARHYEHSDNWFLARPKRCHIGNGNCSVLLPKSQTMGYVQADLAILRLSTRFAVEIRRALTAVEFRGHHEAILYPICAATSWCLWDSTVPFMSRGVFTTGGWGWLLRVGYTIDNLLKAAHRKLARPALYHPVKTGCNASMYMYTSGPPLEYLP